MPVLQGASLSFIDDAEYVFTTEVDLPADIDEVWAVIADNGSWTEWFKDCKAMESSDDPWTAAGQTRTIKVTPFVIEESAIAIEPPNLWAMQFSRTNLPMASRAVERLELFDSTRNGEKRTEVRWTGAFDLPFYLKPASSIFEQLMVRKWGESLETLLDAVIARR